MKDKAGDNDDDDDDGPMVQYGGILDDDETDKAIEQAIQARVISGKKTMYKVKFFAFSLDFDAHDHDKNTVKVEMNAVAVRPKTLKEARGGHDKWVLGHLPQGTGITFTKEVIPLARKKAGCLDPWDNLTVQHVQEIVDKVFGSGKYEVTEDDAWYGLVCRYCIYYEFLMNHMIEVIMRLHNWRNGFAQAALNTINLFVERNSSELNTKELIAEEIKAHLEKVDLMPKNGASGSSNVAEDNEEDEESYTYAFQWGEWSIDKKERKV